jgi:hypothetical protein
MVNQDIEHLSFLNILLLLHGAQMDGSCIFNGIIDKGTYIYQAPKKDNQDTPLDTPSSCPCLEIPPTIIAVQKVPLRKATILPASCCFFLGRSSRELLFFLGRSLSVRNLFPQE